MLMPASSSHEKAFLQALSVLTLAPARAGQVYPQLCELTEREFAELSRWPTPITSCCGLWCRCRVWPPKLGDDALVSRCQARIEQEQLRIANAVQHLFVITGALEAAGCPTTVMKSLDHWPDLGNDLDLYTTASASQVCHVMTVPLPGPTSSRKAGATASPTSGISTFAGLPEAVEVHAQRLGQTGEHIAMAQRFVTRRVKQSVLGLEFGVPAPEERIIVATLQRMYRHFYFRICDIVNIAALVESGAVDFVELHRAASMGGIWKGVCSLLRIVSDYVLQYRGTPVVLPSEVLADALFGGEKLYVKRGFIRVPILPQCARLYAAQVTTAALRGDLAGNPAPLPAALPRLGRRHQLQTYRQR